MPVDIIIYAVVAAVMVFWLRSVLGTRHGQERERANPFEEQPESKTKTPNDKKSSPLSPIDMESKTQNAMTVGNDKIDAGLVQIALADRHFNIDSFTENAKDAFSIIVTAFAEGDRNTLHDMCTDDVYKAFDSAIKERENAGETVTTEIHAIRNADITDAGMSKKTAFVTLRISADETYVVQDKNGEILAGHPDRVSDMTDKWTFSRDTKSNDPRWFLSKTEDDVIEDEHGKTPMPDAG
jgi:predicted lipid-binding transport protein (Tim44 family)